VGEANAHSLANSKKWFEGRVSGAEHIEFHCPAHASRCKAFTGLSDGSIASFDPDAGPDGPIDILNRTSALEHGNAPNFLQHCGDVEYAHLCGRPLGLKVAPDGKYLIIADAYFGILALDFATREVLLVANEYVDQNGAVQRINMPNSLVITRSGRVLFTQTSPQFSFKNLMLEFMQGRDTGLLLSLSHYAPGAGHRASVAADGLVENRHTHEQALCVRRLLASHPHPSLHPGVSEWTRSLTLGGLCACRIEPEGRNHTHPHRRLGEVRTCHKPPLHPR
jgi:hypothetical protein